MVLDFLALPLGICIGAIGSLTGIGGGFLIMPILLLLYPDKSVAGLTIISMIVVLFNSMAGTIPALLRRRINWKVALPYALVTIPTSLAGLLLQAQIAPGPFRKVFGGFMMAAALFLIWRQTVRTPVGQDSTTDRGRFWIGLVASIGIGVISSFFGVGGGFLFVPLFVYFLGQPARQATANSQLILIFVSTTTLIAGTIQGHLELDTQLLAFLVVGVVGGAQIGSALAERMKSNAVMLLLAILMIVAGIRIAFF